MGIMLWNNKVLFRRAYGSKIAADSNCCCGSPCECIVWYGKGYGTIEDTFPPFSDEYEPAVELANWYYDAPIFVKLRNANDFLRDPNDWGDFLITNKTSATNSFQQSNDGFFCTAELNLRYAESTLGLQIFGNLHCFGDGEHDLLRVNDTVWYTVDGPAWVLRVRLSLSDSSWSPGSVEVEFVKVLDSNCTDMGHPSPTFIDTWDAYDVRVSGQTPGELDWPLDGDTMPYGMGTNTLYEWATPEIEIVDNPFP